MTSEFRSPSRAILNIGDMRSFSSSKTYKDFLGFIRAGGDAIKCTGIISGKYHVSPVINLIEDMLNEMESWIREYPPLDQPMRFGNRAFCSWHRHLMQSAPSLINNLLPKDLLDNGACNELLPYLCTSFGNERRIDYGTGHETNFVIWLYCLHLLDVIKEGDMTAMVLRCFSRYLRVMRGLHVAYMLEPAGSHGAWGLDDYHCIPFLWGAAQLIDHPNLTPSNSSLPEVLVEYADDWMYLGAVQFTWELKKGVPFGECCPMLNDISLLPGWKKVFIGMIKLYEGEVLGKLPVVQHLLFGSLFKATWAVTEISNSKSTLINSKAEFDPFINCQAPWAVGDIAESTDENRVHATSNVDRKNAKELSQCEK